MSSNQHKTERETMSLEKRIAADLNDARDYMGLDQQRQTVFGKLANIVNACTFWILPF